MKKDDRTGCFCQECGLKKFLYSLFRSKFCIFCGKRTLSDFRIFLSDTINIKESIRLRHKREGFGKFVSEIINGWFPSRDYPGGVNKQRIVDKQKNEYHEIVKDNNTGETIHECHEPLNQHKN